MTITLPIDFVSPPQPTAQNWQHGVIWQGVQAVSIPLEDAHWYGQGGLLHQLYPLEKTAQYPARFLTSDNGNTGLSSLLHPFWWNSAGFGVLVESGDDFEFSFNAPLVGQPHAHSFTAPAPLDERPLPAAAIQTDGLLRIWGDNLTLRFFSLGDARQVVEAFWALIEISPPPPPAYLQKTLWTTWAAFKNDIDHAKIMDFAQKIAAYDFNAGVLGIDAKWQAEFGSTRFDLAKFPDPAGTIAALHDLGMKVTLWAIPFFHPQTEHYPTALEKDYALRAPNGDVYIAAWWEGQAAFLDVTQPAALDWHLDNLQALAESINLDGFKFDAGEGMFYANPHIALNTAPNSANNLYLAALARRYPWSDVRSGWRSQAAPLLFRQWDKSTHWGFDNGLASCIPQAISLNLLGYPYSFPDMIGGNQYGNDTPSAELLIRWTQAVAPMPIIQFSIPPWQFGDECAALCARYARLHGALASYSQNLHPAPIVRPLWWLAPTDETALTVDDSYLIGDDLLVAPVIVEGARERDIYLPPGTWHSYWNAAEVHSGGRWLRGYPAPLDTLPLFVRG